MDPFKPPALISFKPLGHLALSTATVTLTIAPSALATDLTVPPEKAPQPTSAQVKTETNTSTEATFQVFPVGFKIGDRNSPISSVVRGYEDGRQAVDFEQWLIPFEDVVQALQIQVKPQANGMLELRSPTVVLQLSPEELATDEELGLAWSVAQIQRYLDIGVSFDLADYAIRFDPPRHPVDIQRQAQGDRPILTEGLPQIAPATFGLTAISQTINLSGEPGDGSPTEANGTLSAYGSALGGSVFLQLDQEDWQDRSTWQLTDAQYLRQTEQADWVLGSQPTFWRSRQGNEFWGISNVQRWNFSPPPDTSSSGFNPRQRLQARRVERTISGEATPGTLVRLIQRGNRSIIDEKLVDSTGIYRFESIPTGESGGYELELYPDGQLTAEPITRSANFSILPGQLPQGSSALITSLGSSRYRENDDDSFDLLGSFEGLRGGLLYRHGLSESLTLGSGISVEASTQALVDAFYSPTQNVEMSLAGRLNTSDGNVEVDGRLRWQPSPQFSLNLDGDQLSQRLRANWRVGSNLSLLAQGDTRDESIGAGGRLSQRWGNWVTSASGLVTTNGKARWSINSRLGNLQFRHRGNDTVLQSELSYGLGRSSNTGHRFRFKHESRDVNDEERSLASMGWRYRSRQRRSGRSLWDIDLGYGLGTEGQGPIASLGTRILPGLDLRLRYQGVSATSGQSSFRVQLSPRLRTQQGIALGDRTQDELRNRGGILIRPFFDTTQFETTQLSVADTSIATMAQTSDGVKSETKDAIAIAPTSQPSAPLLPPLTFDLDGADLLFQLNHQSLKGWKPRIDDQGIWITLPPDQYCLDLDPAGLPLGWQSDESAYGVDVVSGQYTTVSIPLRPSYTRNGRILDHAGEPVGGARIEAVAAESGKRQLSITNGAGVFYLEGLGQGQHWIEINGQRLPNTDLLIQPDSAPFESVNFVVPSQTLEG